MRTTIAFSLSTSMFLLACSSSDPSTLSTAATESLQKGIACEPTPTSQPIEGELCPEQWYEAAPPIPGWHFPPTLGQMLPIDIGNVAAVNANFLVPITALQTVLPPNMHATVVSAGLGVVAISFSDNQDLTFCYDETLGSMKPYREVDVSVLVDDPSQRDGYSPLWMDSMVVSSEQAVWGGIEGWGYPKIFGNAQCHVVDRQGIKCEAAAKGGMILQMQVDTARLETVVADYEQRAMFLSSKDGYLVHVPVVGHGTTYIGSDAATITLGNHPIAERLRALGVGQLPSVLVFWSPSLTGDTLDRGQCTPMP